VSIGSTRVRYPIIRTAPAHFFAMAETKLSIQNDVEIADAGMNAGIFLKSIKSDSVERYKITIVNR
jgi:hypothetical protein